MFILKYFRGVLTKGEVFVFNELRGPLKIHFVRQAKFFNSGLPQAKAVLASAKADLASLPGCKNLLLSD